MRSLRTIAVVALAVLASGCATAGGDGGGDTRVELAVPAESTAFDLPTVTVHKTESCACCGEYETYLTEHGVDIEVVLHDDMGPFKDEVGVPADQRSCHTNEVAGYFVEGHVPVEAIAALVDQAPDVDGISLAGRPPGSPGMPGEQTEPFVVTTAVDGEVVGELGRF